MSKEFVFTQTNVYTVEADSYDEAMELMLGEDAERYLINTDLEFKGEE